MVACIFKLLVTPPSRHMTSKRPTLKPPAKEVKCHRWHLIRKKDSCHWEECITSGVRLRV